VAAISGEKVNGIVVAGPKRLDAIPNVPTAQEAGVADFQLNIWSGIYAPKGTPKDIIDKLAVALDKTLDEPATAERLGKLGGTVPPKAERGPDTAQDGGTDIPRWAPILKEAAASNRNKFSSCAAAMNPSWRRLRARKKREHETITHCRC
jgi:tripartite-type tricarboxylate transporter receptor subunit TctC